MSEPVFSVFQPVCIGTIKDNQKSTEITHSRQKHPNVNYTINENNDPVEWYYYIHEQPEDLLPDSQEKRDELETEYVTKRTDDYSDERITRNIDNLTAFCEIIERDITWWIVNDIPIDPMDEDNHMEKRLDFETRKLDSYANHLVVLIDSIIDNDRFSKDLFGSYKKIKKAIENSHDVKYRVDLLARLQSIAYSVVAPRVNYQEKLTVTPRIASGKRPVEA